MRSGQSATVLAFGRAGRAERQMQIVAIRELHGVNRSFAESRDARRHVQGSSYSCCTGCQLVRTSVT